MTNTPQTDQPSTAAGRTLLDRWTAQTKPSDQVSASLAEKWQTWRTEFVAAILAIEAEARDQVECPEATLEVTDDGARADTARPVEPHHPEPGTIAALRAALERVMDDVRNGYEVGIGATGQAMRALTASSEPARIEREKIVAPWRAVVQKWHDSGRHSATCMSYDKFRCDCGFEATHALLHHPTQSSYCVEHEKEERPPERLIRRIEVTTPQDIRAEIVRLRTHNGALDSLLTWLDEPIAAGAPTDE